MAIRTEKVPIQEAHGTMVFSFKKVLSAFGGLSCLPLKMLSITKASSGRAKLEFLFTKIGVG